MLLRKVLEINTHHACENVIFVNMIGACFSPAQNSEHDPMRNYVTNSLIFNYNFLPARNRKRALDNPLF
jgi:hypothetical protein